MENTERLRVVRSHALDRYQEHYPEAGKDDVLQAATYGTEIPTSLARTMVGRPSDYPGCDDLDRYILSPSRRGMFVARRDTGAIRTYLRFGAQQQTFAKKHWPIPGDVSIDLEPELAEQTELPDHDGTREVLERLYYPLLEGDLSKLAISRSLRMSLGFTKAFKVRLAFARAVLDDLDLFCMSPPKPGEQVDLVLQQRHGLRERAGPTDVVLVVHNGNFCLRRAGIVELDLADTDLPTSPYALQKLVGE